MGKGRLEAFSDGVIAVIITIMVLEVKVPHGADLEALRPVVPQLASYLLSFVIIGIYWNGHHHMLHVAKRVDARMMWLNLHLLFWLSLIPVTTGWVGENPEAEVPAALYGGVFLLAAIAFNLLQGAIRKNHEDDPAIAAVLGRRAKGRISELLYVAGIGLAFVRPWIADALYVAVAVMWFVPDRAIERTVVQHEK
jgi:uncharacterized membrane protein